MVGTPAQREEPERDRKQREWAAMRASDTSRERAEEKWRQFEVWEKEREDEEQVRRVATRNRRWRHFRNRARAVAEAAMARDGATEAACGAARPVAEAEAAAAAEAEAAAAQGRPPAKRPARESGSQAQVATTHPHPRAGRGGAFSAPPLPPHGVILTSTSRWLTVCMTIFPFSYPLLPHATVTAWFA